MSASCGRDDPPLLFLARSLRAARRAAAAALAASASADVSASHASADGRGGVGGDGCDARDFAPSCGACGALGAYDNLPSLILASLAAAVASSDGGARDPAACSSLSGISTTSGRGLSSVSISSAFPCSSSLSVISITSGSAGGGGFLLPSAFVVGFDFGYGIVAFGGSLGCKGFGCTLR